MPLAHGRPPHELGQLSLRDALALCLLLCDRDPRLFDRAAARRVARLVVEARGLTLAEVQLAVAALAALRGVDVDAPARALGIRCRKHGQRGAAEELERWAAGRQR